MSDANKQLMRDMFAALSAGDADGFLGPLADAANRLLGGLGGQLDGGLTVLVDDMVADGDWVVGRGRGLSRTTPGSDYNNEYCGWYRIVDGKVVEIIEYLDTELVTTVLGR